MRCDCNERASRAVSVLQATTTNTWFRCLASAKHFLLLKVWNVHPWPILTTCTLYTRFLGTKRTVQCISRMPNNTQLKQIDFAFERRRACRDEKPVFISFCCSTASILYAIESRRIRRRRCQQANCMRMILSLSHSPSINDKLRDFRHMHTSSSYTHQQTVKDGATCLADNFFFSSFLLYWHVSNVRAILCIHLIFRVCFCWMISTLPTDCAGDIAVACISSCKFNNNDLFIAYYMSPSAVATVVRECIWICWRRENRMQLNAKFTLHCLRTGLECGFFLSIYYSDSQPHHSALYRNCTKSKPFTHKRPCLTQIVLRTLTQKMNENDRFIVRRFDFYGENWSTPLHRHCSVLTHSVHIALYFVRFHNASIPRQIHS